MDETETAGNATSRPMRALKTTEGYAVRARRLMRRCLADGGPAPNSSGITPSRLVDWLVAQKPHWAAATWRQNKAAVSATFERLIEERTAQREAQTDGAAALRIEARLAALHQALASLQQVKSSGCVAKTNRTSACKAKRLSEPVRHAITTALAQRPSRHADDLAAYLLAGVRTGLRPVEWAGAHVLAGDYRGDLVLQVRNAKAGGLRAHGPTRTLIFAGLPAAEQAIIRRWIARVHAAGAGVDALFKALGDLLHGITRELWPRRATHPSLYSTRHQFAGLAKLRFDAAKVAALMGHASDLTATSHYGRYRSGRGVPAALQAMLDRLPRPDPAEVRRVRRRLGASRAKLHTAQDAAEAATLAGDHRGGGSTAAQQTPVS